MKKILLGTLCCLSLLTLSGCGNKQVFDTTYTFNKAIIELPDGTIKEGKISSWTDYSDRDQLQIKFNDGTTYLVHSSDCVLIAE